jgi:hypothetical protein
MLSATKKGSISAPHPLYPPLLTRREGGIKKEGLSPLLDTPIKQGIGEQFSKIGAEIKKGDVSASPYLTKGEVWL